MKIRWMWSFVCITFPKTNFSSYIVTLGKTQTQSHFTNFQGRMILFWGWYIYGWIGVNDGLLNRGSGVCRVDLRPIGWRISLILQGVHHKIRMDGRTNGWLRERYWHKLWCKKTSSKRIWQAIVMFTLRCSRLLRWNKRNGALRCMHAGNTVVPYMLVRILRFRFLMRFLLRLLTFECKRFIWFAHQCLWLCKWIGRKDLLVCSACFL